MRDRPELTLAQLPTLPFGLAILLGVAASLFLAASPVGILIASVLLLAIAIGSALIFRGSRVLLAASLCALFLLAWYRGSEDLGREARWDVHELAANGEEVRVIGRVCAIGADSRHGSHVLLADVEIGQDSIRTEAGRLRVRLYSDSATLGSLRYGDLVAASGELRSSAVRAARFSGTMLGALTRREVADLFADPEDLVTQPVGGYRVRRAVDQARGYIARTFNEHLSPDAASLSNALILGDRREFGYRFNEQLRITGLSHIFALSGLNTGLIVSLLWVFLGLFFVPRTARYWLLLVGALFYMELGREVPSLVRSTLMCSMFLVGRIVQRRGHVLNYVSAALCIELLWRPMDIVDPGFALSYLAVYGIIGGFEAIRLGFVALIGSERVGFRRRLIDLSAGTLSAQIGTMPLVGFLFQRIPLLGALGNLIVIPGFSLLLILVCAMLLVEPIPFAAEALGATIELAGAALAWIVDFFAELPWSGVRVAAPSALLTCVVYVAMAVILVAISRFRWRTAAIWTLATGILLSGWSFVAPADRATRLSFIDVGIGDAILLESADQHCVLIDAGGRYREWSGARTIYPFLQDHGITELDALILTHPDTDHIGGAASLMNQIPIHKIWTNGLASESRSFFEYQLELERLGVEHGVLSAGDVLHVGQGVTLIVLAPDSLIRADSNTPNQAGIVMRLDTDGRSALLTADIDSTGEVDLLGWGPRLRVDVLKVAHHGSKSSSCRRFLDACDPQIAVITVGRNNPYGHPHPEVLSRIADAGVECFSTGESSTLIFETTESGWRRVRTPTERLAELWRLPYGYS